MPVVKIDTQARDDKGNPVEGKGAGAVKVRLQSSSDSIDGEGNVVRTWADTKIDTINSESKEYEVKVGRRLIVEEYDK